MAQLGSALDWGSRGRRFKSGYPDSTIQNRVKFGFLKPNFANCNALQNQIQESILHKRQLEYVRPPKGKNTTCISLSNLEKFSQDWIFDGDYRSLSPKTLEARHIFSKNLIWFLKKNNFDSCSARELKLFFVYLSKPQTEGRWGIPRLTKPLRPISVKDYYVTLRCMFRWFVEEELIESSIIEELPPPIARASQIQPFAPEQIEALLEAARQSCHPKRDYAIVSLLLDCGLRASELCFLKYDDVDLNARCVTVLGKGNKRRSIYFGKNTTKALMQHLRGKELESDDWVFTNDRGARAGDSLKPNGLLQLIQRLGKAANIKAVRCSPHTLRHTYAVSFLRAGGSVFTLRESLGHTNLQMTSKYVMVAEADLSQSREFSPMDRLKQSRAGGKRL
jgi:site-specific recombinase XerD